MTKSPRPPQRPRASTPNSTPRAENKPRAENPWGKSHVKPERERPRRDTEAARGTREEAPRRSRKDAGAVPPRKPRDDAKPARAKPRRVDTDDTATFAATPDGVVERKIYGLNAALTFVRERSNAIIRAYFVEGVARKHFGVLMKQLAQTRRAYHVIDADEMQKVTESSHHEGVCLLVRDTPVLRINEWLASAPARSHTVLALEGVANPHNLGAIMRTAAHFGVAAIVTSGAERLRSGAAMRTAEGGAERIPLLEAAGFHECISLLQRTGYHIVVTSSHKGESVFEADWPDRVCIVMGEEQQGVSKPVAALADQCVSIPGTGAVESLNVSVATAIVVAQCAQAQHKRHQSNRPKGTLRKSS